jgi:MarR family transcriptional regulator, organic hydroperoxide resistance regulator
MKTDNTFELVEIVFKISRLMKEEMSYTCNLIHLSILQIQTLIYINKNGKIPMSDIAEYFHIELPSATSLLNKLCDLKLVERHADELDRRLVIITLTTRGKTMLEQAMNERRKKLEKMLSYLSEKERSELLNILTTLHTKLHK